jgi:hypothetical protein
VQLLDIFGRRGYATGRINEGPCPFGAAEEPTANHDCTRMDIASVCYDFVRGMGKCIGGGSRALTAARDTLRESAEKLRPRFSRERIRSIISEELTRLLGKGVELGGMEVEERLQVMAGAILALQERVNELSARGPVSAADMWKEIGSLEAAAPLTDGERSILVNVLRQNIALQKPELAAAAVDYAVAESP